MPRQYIQTLLFASSVLLVQAGGWSRAEVPTREQIDRAAEVQLPSDPAAKIAVVGQSSILLGELAPKVEARISEVLSRVQQQVPEDQIYHARVNFTRAALAQAIQNKMMRESFLLDQVATQSADKRRDADEMMSSKARALFFESEIPELKKQYQTQELTELDRLLKEKGSSLASRQREFVDQMLGHMYIRSKVDKDPTVTLAEINEYYQTHLGAYQHDARARWEQLSVLFAKVPSREAANAMIWEMGREALYGGNLQAVARAKSQEPFASNGGLHDWTAKGSLASQVLDDQIFLLPLNKMSQVIEDADGLHIVRVLEREDEGVTSLADVQDEIRSKLRQQKINESQMEVMESMRDRVPVWSLFPDDIPGAKMLPTSVLVPASSAAPVTAQNTFPTMIR